MIWYTWKWKLARSKCCRKLSKTSKALSANGDVTLRVTEHNALKAESSAVAPAKPPVKRTEDLDVATARVREEVGTLSGHLADATSNYNRVAESLHAHQGHKMDIEFTTQNLATRVTAEQKKNWGAVSPGT